MKKFADLHPAVSFVFFLEVLCLTMIQMHPIILGISCVLALLNLWSLKRERGVTGLKWSIGFALLIAVGNAFLNPSGKTVLFTYLSGRTFTLESLICGGSAALLFTTVILWFNCFHVVMTQEKIQFLFGRIIPSMSLLFSLVLRFVPEFLRQLRTLTQARACLGLGVEQCEGGRKKIQRAAGQLSAFLSLALEQAIVTATSMRGRGYGLPGRKSYSSFRMDWKDVVILSDVIVLGGFAFAAIVLGGGNASYFPTVKVAGGQMLWLSVGAELLLMVIPLLCNSIGRYPWGYGKRSGLEEMR